MSTLSPASRFSSTEDHSRIEGIKERERALSRMLMAYICTGLAFMLLPGTFLGVWNLISITSKKASDSISPAWIQAHGHAQVFGWIGSFILGIGFYSIPKMRQSRPFAMWEAWTTWLLWTVGVSLHWISAVEMWHWHALFPFSALLEAAAFLLFFRTIATHRPSETAVQPAKLSAWIFVVISGTCGLLATLVINVVGSFLAARTSAAPAFSSGLDQRFLVLMTWGFMVPFVWGFSARWLPTFVGLKQSSEHGLKLLIVMNVSAISCAMVGLVRISSCMFLVAALFSLAALHTVSSSIATAKVQGIHRSFPYFVRLAYVWLTIAAALGIWAAFATAPDGIWGASRHALTVGFVATMVFAIGQRVLPAFSGMRLLYSPQLMATGLVLLTAGCTLRVTCEVLAYQGISESAWKWLPLSAVTELCAVTCFAVNMILTFLSKPPSALVQVKT